MSCRGWPWHWSPRVAVCAIIQAWDPPMHWRTGMVPTRYVTSRVEFKQENKKETEQATAQGPRRNQGRFQAGQDAAGAVAGQAPHHDRRPYQGGNADPADAGSSGKEFQPPLEKGAAPPKPQDELASFQEFRKALAGKDNLDQLDHAVAEAFASLEQHGLLAEPAGKAQGFQPEDDRGLPGR